MSWDVPTDAEGQTLYAEDPCPWCNGTGQFVCASSGKALQVMRPEHRSVQHRAFENAVAHRCGQCKGTGIRP